MTKKPPYQSLADQLHASFMLEKHNVSYLRQRYFEFSFTKQQAYYSLIHSRMNMNLTFE